MLEATEATGCHHVCCDKLWSPVLFHYRDKEVAGVVRYVSYWRPTDNGTTDYLSVTIIPDATAQVSWQAISINS